MAKPLDLVVKSSYQTLIHGNADTTGRGHRGQYYHMCCQYPGVMKKFELDHIPFTRMI